MNMPNNTREAAAALAAKDKLLVECEKDYAEISNAYNLKCVVAERQRKLLARGGGALPDILEIERLCGCPKPNLLHIKKIATRVRATLANLKAEMEGK